MCSFVALIGALPSLHERNRLLTKIHADKLRDGEIMVIQLYHHDSSHPATPVVITSVDGYYEFVSEMTNQYLMDYKIDPTPVTPLDFTDEDMQKMDDKFADAKKQLMKDLKDHERDIKEYNRQVQLNQYLEKYQDSEPKKCDLYFDNIMAIMYDRIKISFPETY